MDDRSVCKPVPGAKTRRGPSWRFTIATVFLATIASPVGADESAPTSRSANENCRGSAKVITVGTAGGPEGNNDRSQPATFFRFAETGVLIDAGDGTANQLAKAGIPIKSVTHLLVSHLHFDHTAGIDALISFRWLNGTDDDPPLVVLGPRGTNKLVRDILSSLTAGESLFAPLLPGRRPIAPTVKVVELGAAQITGLDPSEQVRLSWARNTHYASLDSLTKGPSSQSYSYRLDTPCGAITFSGDTGPSDALIRLAAGSRMLVSEIIDAEQASRLTSETMGPGVDTAAMIQHMKRHHLSAQEVARTASAAGVPLVVLTHFVAADGETMKRDVLASYSGQVIAATDGMAIDPW